MAARAEEKRLNVVRTALLLLVGEQVRFVLQNGREDLGIAIGVDALRSYHAILFLHFRKLTCGYKDIFSEEVRFYYRI